MLYVRTDGAVRRLEAAELADSDLSLHSEVAIREVGPFEPLAHGIERNGPLRDALARALPIRSLRGYGRLRLVLLATILLPTALLLELDRELVGARRVSASHGAIDLILVAFVAAELARPAPRARGTCAFALVAIALRWTLVASRLCGRGVDPVVFAGAGLAALAAVLWLTRVPSRSRIALEIASELGIGRSELFRATTPPDPPAALLAAAVGCAAALPALLHSARMLGLGLGPQALASIAFATVAPYLARRATDKAAPKMPPASPARVLAGVVAGIALAAAAVTAGRLFFDVGTEVARCVQRLDAEARLMHAAEVAELTSAAFKVRASLPLFIVSTLVLPFAEERIFRGLLLDTLARKYGRPYGLLASSLAFGVAHLGIYHVALYQTVLLGMGFGVAYLEGGLLAAYVVHATWNLLQSGG